MQVREWMPGVVKWLKKRFSTVETTLVRRLFLAPGEATRWHRDPFRRVTVVFQGAALAIEFRDRSPLKHVTVKPGQVDWDEPGDRPHRAVNSGAVPYEEITVSSCCSRTMFPSPTRLSLTAETLTARYLRRERSARSMTVCRFPPVHAFWISCSFIPASRPQRINAGRA